MCICAAVWKEDIIFMNKWEVTRGQPIHIKLCWLYQTAVVKQYLKFILWAHCHYFRSAYAMLHCVEIFRHNSQNEGRNTAWDILRVKVGKPFRKPEGCNGIICLSMVLFIQNNIDHADIKPHYLLCTDLLCTKTSSDVYIHAVLLSQSFL